MIGFSPILMILMMLSAPMVMLTEGSGDPTDHLDSKLFWKGRGIDMTAANLLEAANPPASADATAHLSRLGAPEFRERQAAEKALLALGPGILPQVRPLTRSEDPEVAERAVRIVRALAPRDSFSDVQRLMAIRGLGELGDAAALPALRPLAEATDPATRAYAARAIARIEGRPAPAPARDAEAVEQSFHGMSEGHVLVAVRPSDRPALSIPALIHSTMGEFGLDADMIRQQCEDTQAEFTAVLEKTGPFRIDLLLLRAGQRPAALGEEPKRWYAALLTGQFDTNRIARAVESLEEGTGDLGLPAPERRVRNGVVYYDLGGEIALMLISPRHIAMSYAPDQPVGIAFSHCMEMRQRLAPPKGSRVVHGNVPLNMEARELSEAHVMAAAFTRKLRANAPVAEDDPFPARTARLFADPAEEGAWRLEASGEFPDAAVAASQKARLLDGVNKARGALAQGAPMTDGVREAMDKMETTVDGAGIRIRARLPAGFWLDLPQALMMTGVQMGEGVEVIDEGVEVELEAAPAPEEK